MGKNKEIITKWHYPFVQRNRIKDEAGRDGCLINMALFCDRAIDEIEQVRDYIKKTKIRADSAEMKDLGLDESGDYFLSKWILHEGNPPTKNLAFEKASKSMQEMLGEEYRYI